MCLKWFQYKCNNRIHLNVLLTVLCLFLNLSTNLSSANPSRTKKKQAHPANPLPTLLQEVETLYTKAATLSADFSQINDQAALSQQKKSSGKIFVKRPSQVRWETSQPDVSLFVSDGVHSWFYTPPFEPGERGQVIERSASEAQSQLSHALLSGSFSMARHMKIVQKDLSTFLLIPKTGTAGSVTQATIVIEPHKKWIQKVILEHQGKNRTEITLSNIQLATTLQDDLFIFHVPPNTDRVDNPQED